MLSPKKKKKKGGKNVTEVKRSKKVKNNLVIKLTPFFFGVGGLNRKQKSFDSIAKKYLSNYSFYLSSFCYAFDDFKQNNKCCRQKAEQKKSLVFFFFFYAFKLESV